MPEYRQPVDDPRMRAAVANALYRAFLDLEKKIKDDLELPPGGTLQRALSTLKHAMAEDPAAPLLAYGRPYAEWADPLGFIESSSAAKAFLELATLVNAYPPFPISVDGDAGRKVRFTIVRPGEVKGGLAGLVVHVTLGGQQLEGTFPKDQKGFLTPRGVNPLERERREAVGVVLREAPGFLTSVRRLLEVPSRQHRRRVFDQAAVGDNPGFGVDVVVTPRLRPRTALATAPLLVLGLGLAYVAASDDQQLDWTLTRTESALYQISLAWDAHGNSPESFVVTRRSTEDTTVEVPTSIPALVTGLHAGTTYEFRIRHRLLGIRWAPVTRRTIVQVPIQLAAGPFRAAPEPPFGCTQIRVEPADPRIGQPAVLSASLYGTDIRDLHLSWSLGDHPGALEGNPVTVTFHNSGTHLIALTVSSAGGSARRCEGSVVVRGAADASPTSTPPLDSTELNLDGDVRALEPLGGTLVVAAHRDAVSIVDVGIGHPPTLITRLPVVGASDVAVLGRRVYVAAGPGGLVRLDLTDPRRPVVLGTDPGVFEHIAVREERLLASAHSSEVRLLSLDASGQTHPLSAFPLLSGRTSRLIFVDDTLAVSAREKDDAGFGAGIALLNFVDGTHGQMVTPEPVSDVAVYGGVAFIASPLRELTLARVNGVHPSGIGPGADKRTWALRTLSASLVGDRLYVGSLDGQTQIFDVSLPTQPRLLGELPTMAAAFRVIEIDHRLIVGSAGRLIVMSRPN